MFSPQYYANPAAYASPMGNPSTMQMQRLAQMEQQYPQFAQQPMGQNFTQQQAPIYMKCRAVTSIDEAKAAMIDLDGSLHVFTDIPHRKNLYQTDQPRRNCFSEHILSGGNSYSGSVRSHSPELCKRILCSRVYFHSDDKLSTE